MFERNDKALLTARKIIIFIIVIFAALSLAMGIVLAIQVHGAMFLLALGGWFGCWLMWVVARLFLSYLVDIKLIRNKLYDEKNTKLEVFLEDNED